MKLRAGRTAFISLQLTLGGLFHYFSTDTSELQVVIIYEHQVAIDLRIGNFLYASSDGDQQLPSIFIQQSHE